MVEELRRWNSSAHVEVWSICEKCRILFTDRKQQIAELSEIQFSIVVWIVPSEKKVDIVMSKAIKSNIFSQGHYDVLDWNITSSSSVKDLKSIE